MKRGRHLPTSLPPPTYTSLHSHPLGESGRARAQLAGTPSHRSSAPSRSSSWGAAGSTCLPGWAPVLHQLLGTPVLPSSPSRELWSPKGHGRRGWAVPAGGHGSRVLGLHGLAAGMDPGALGAVDRPCRRCVGHPTLSPHPPAEATPPSPPLPLPVPTWLSALPGYFEGNHRQQVISSTDPKR